MGVPIRLEDKRLVKRMLAREDAAFNEFFAAYFPRLYRFALTRLRDDADATRDVVQAALVKAVRKLHTYRGEAALFTWLCTICRNELSDHFARTARDRAHLVLTEDYPEIEAAVDSFRAPPEDDPVRGFQRVETARLIQVALDRLPPRYGDALEWKYVYGFSAQEVADKLGVGREAAQSLLARAKRAFYEVYRSLLSAPEDESAATLKSQRI